MTAAPRIELAHEVLAPLLSEPRPEALVSVVDAMAPADASDLSRASLQRRFDRKYLLRAESAAALLALVAEDYRVVLAGSARFALYDTVYFDSPDLRCYHDHRRRRKPRFKVRVRHYVDRGFSMLEVKQKTQRGDTTKHRFEREGTELAMTDAEQEHVRSIAPGLFHNGPLVPQARTVFSRLMIIGKRSVERATLDFDLVLECGERRRPVPFIVVEVKDTGHGATSPLVLALRAAHAKQSSFSKYSVAVASLGGQRTTTLRPLVTLVHRGLR